MGAAAGEKKDEKTESYIGFHGIGVLDSGYKKRDKLIIGNR